jgi:hypothetical protein
MDITIAGNAETIVKRLVEIGRYPSPDSLVNEAILRTFPHLQLLPSQERILPDPVSLEEPVSVPDFPYRESLPVRVTLSKSHRLPDPIFD